jgi:hypothetical protein
LITKKDYFAHNYCPQICPIVAIGVDGYQVTPGGGAGADTDCQSGVRETGETWSERIIFLKKK